MNYLTHFVHNYHLLGHPQEAGFYYWGIILPDLAKIYDVRCRFRLSQIRLLAAEYGKLSIWDGIRHHLTSDQAFHQSDFFIALQKEYLGTLDGLRQSFPEAVSERYDRLLAHIGIELLFDYEFFIAYPGINHLFYKTISAVSPDSVIRSCEPVLENQTGMVNHLQQFLQARYLDRYGNLHLLTETLIYKIRRFGDPPPVSFIHFSLERMQPFVAQQTEALIQLMKKID